MYVYSWTKKKMCKYSAQEKKERKKAVGKYLVNPVQWGNIYLAHKK